MAGGGEGLGFGLGQVEELHLDRVDLAGQIGRVDAVDARGHGGGLLLVEYAGGLQPLPRGGRLVIDAFLPTVRSGRERRWWVKLREATPPTKVNLLASAAKSPLVLRLLDAGVTVVETGTAACAREQD